MQILEQNLQSLIMQKQAFQVELSETEAAISELGKTEGDVFKIIGSIMIKSKREGLIKELNHKKELINLRLKSIDRDEGPLIETAEKLREKVLSKIKN